MPLKEVADHAGTMATKAGDFGAASGGKCCHGASALVASAFAHLRCGCGLAQQGQAVSAVHSCSVRCAGTHVWVSLAHEGGSRSCCGGVFRAAPCTPHAA